VLPPVRLAARDRFPSLKDFPQIADCRATPSLRPNAHTEVILIDSVDVARGSGQHGSSRALGTVEVRARACVCDAVRLRCGRAKVHVFVVWVFPDFTPECSPLSKIGSKTQSPSSDPRV